MGGTQEQGKRGLQLEGARKYKDSQNARTVCLNIFSLVTKDHMTSNELWLSTWSNFDLCRDTCWQKPSQNRVEDIRFLFSRGSLFPGSCSRLVPILSKCSLKQISNCLSSLKIWIKKMTKFLVLPLDTSGQNRSTNGEKSWWPLQGWDCPTPFHCPPRSRKHSSFDWTSY